ncbi:MAG: hypothetical protein ACOCWQ_00965 [Nanoarchaeota archaeon]
MRRSQTATEYLIVLAVVIVMGVIAVGVMGGIPSIGGEAGEQAAKMRLLTAKIGITNYMISEAKGYFEFINNQAKSIRLENATVDGKKCWFIGTNVNPELTPTLGPGQKKKIACGSITANPGERYDYDVTITYTDLETSAVYVLDDLKMVGRGSSFSCPDGYVAVPGGFVLADGSTVDDFCVMKYEAKNVGGVATSQAAGTPWVSITQTDAIANCTALGDGYDLISDQQWMVLAENILNTPINDLNASASGPQLSNGRSSMDWGDGSAAAGPDPDVTQCDTSYSLDASQNENCGLRGSEGYVDTDGSWSMAYSASTDGRGDLRTHVLSNGEVIWDVAGNVFSWTSTVLATTPDDNNYYDSATDFTDVEWMEPSQARGSTYGFGYYGMYGNSDRVAVRGGSWGSGDGAGVFGVDGFYGPSFSSTDFGFRCVHSPGG